MEIHDVGGNVYMLNKRSKDKLFLVSKMATINQLELQQKLIGIRLTIQFKEYLIERDAASRRIVLEKSKEWFEEETKLASDVLSRRCLEWFNELYAINSHSPEKIKDIYNTLWDNLITNLSSCLALQKLINFFLNSTLPSTDLR